MASITNTSTSSTGIQWRGIHLEITAAGPPEETFQGTTRVIRPQKVDLSINVSGTFQILDDSVMKDIVEKMKQFKEQIESSVREMGYVRGSFKWTITSASA